VSAPGLDGHLRLAQAVEDLTPELLVAELAVEALDIAVLPRRTLLGYEPSWPRPPQASFGLPAEIPDRDPRLVLLQDPDDPIIAEPALAHRPSSLDGS
jgi:hypothetical protein